MRLASRKQEDNEVAGLRYVWNEYLGTPCVTDRDLRALIRMSNPSRVAQAIRLCHDGFVASRCRWSDRLLRKALGRFVQKLQHDATH